MISLIRDLPLYARPTMLGAAMLCAVLNPANAADIASVAGVWAGDAQALVTSKGIVEDGSHYVTGVQIRVEPEGKVTGFLAGPHCRFLGLASQGAQPADVDLDLTLSRCEFPGLNARYSGRLSTKSGKITLQLDAVQSMKGSVRRAEVKGSSLTLVSAAN